MTTVSEPHLTPLDLDRLELYAGAAPDASIERHIAGCPDCAARATEHAELARHFRTTVFPRTLANVVTPHRRPNRRWWVLAAVPMMVAAVVVALGPLRTRRAPGERQPEIGVKGEPALHVFVRRAAKDPGAADAVMRLTNGGRLSPGDAMRFVLDPVDLPYAMIASVDGAGQTSIYFPFHGERSQPIEARRGLAVPGSIVLDHAPGPERLFAIYSAQPLDAQLVRDALAGSAAGGAAAIRDLRRLPIPNTAQATVVFEKDVTP